MRHELINICETDCIKNKLRIKLIEEYRNISSEKYINLYALSHLIKEIKQINRL